MTFVSELKSKVFVDLCKVDFLILVSYSFNLIETAALSTLQVLIYLYTCVPVFWPLCGLPCVFVRV